MQNQRGVPVDYLLFTTTQVALVTSFENNDLKGYTRVTLKILVTKQVADSHYQVTWERNVYVYFETSNRPSYTETMLAIEISYCVTEKKS